MQVKLYDSEFEITDAMLIEGRFLVKTVIPLAETATKKIGNAYDNYGNLENAATQLFNLKESTYATAAEYYVTLLHENNLRDYDYQVEDFMNDYYATFGNTNVDEICEILVEYFNKFSSKKIFAEYKRDFRKATRGRFYGANLSTSAVAGSLNLLSGAAHSIFNAIDGAITNSGIDDDMDTVYQMCGKEIWICTFDDVYKMGELFFKFTNAETFYLDNENKARKIQNAIDAGQVPQNRLREKVAQVLFLIPQYDDVYIWAFKLLGDDSYRLIKYAEIFEQKAAVKEIYSAMDDLEIQKKKKQQELKIKAEKVHAAKVRQDELKSLSQKIFGDKAAEIDKKFAANRFYSVLLDNFNANNLADKIYNSFAKFSKYTKYIWSRDKSYFDSKLNILKETFTKFKVSPPPVSEVNFIVCCDEYFSSILLTGQKIYFVPIEEKPLAYSFDEIKNFQFVRKEGVMTYNDYITVNGKNIMTAEFDAEVFNAVKDILEIFKLKNRYLTATAANKTSVKIGTPSVVYRSVDDFIRQIKNSYSFNTYVYYSGADDKAKKKFNAAIESYAKLAQNEVPFVLFDSTLFGSAKDGFILTDKGFYSHGIGLEQNFIPYDRLGVAQDSNKNGKVIKINSTEIDTVALKDEDIEKLVKVIREFREYFTSPESKKPAPKIEKPVKNVPVTANTWEEWADVTENLPQKVETPIKKISDDDIKIFVKQLQEKYKFRYDIYFNDFSKENTKPQKKIKAAVESYAKLAQNEIALICCDSTLFGGGGEGFLITNKGVHSKSMLHNYSFIGYVDNNLTVSQNERRVVLNGAVELDTGTFSTDEKNFLINLINECKKYFS